VEKDHEKNLRVSLLIYALMSISKMKIGYTIKKAYIDDMLIFVFIIFYN